MLRIFVVLILLPLLVPTAPAASAEIHVADCDPLYAIPERTPEILREEVIASFTHSLLFDFSLLPDAFRRARAREIDRVARLGTDDLTSLAGKSAKGKEGECGLSPIEAGFLRSYTGHNTVRLNEDLRGVCPDCVTEVKDVMNRGLAKLAPFRGDVVRFATLPADALAAHQPGSLVCYPAFTSSSALPKWEWAGDVRFVIHSVAGRSIAAFSQFPGEREVLFAAGSCFRVLTRLEEASRVSLELQQL